MIDNKVGMFPQGYYLNLRTGINGEISRNSLFPYYPYLL